MPSDSRKSGTQHASKVEMEQEERQFLTFTLGEEDYGVDILKVQEIRGWSKVRPLPNAPPHILGVLHLRGTIIPVVDMRQRFGLEAAEVGRNTVIIILRVEAGQGARHVGIVVDRVDDVRAIPRQEIRTTPDLGSHVDTRYIEGIAARDEQMLMLLDADRLFGTDELTRMARLAGQSPNETER